MLLDLLAHFSELLFLEIQRALDLAVPREHRLMLLHEQFLHVLTSGRLLAHLSPDLPVKFFLPEEALIGRVEVQDQGLRLLGAGSLSAVQLRFVACHDTAECVDPLTAHLC